MREILDQDASVLNAFPSDGHTPVGLAALFDQKTVLELLVSVVKID